MEYGAVFEYDNIKYQVVGKDIYTNEIECISIPNDTKHKCFYWFKIISKDGVDKLIMNDVNKGD